MGSTNPLGLELMELRWEVDSDGLCSAAWGELRSKKLAALCSNHFSQARAGWLLSSVLSAHSCCGTLMRWFRSFEGALVRRFRRGLTIVAYTSEDAADWLRFEHGQVEQLRILL